MKALAYFIDSKPRLTWPAEYPELDENGNPTGVMLQDFDTAIAALPPDTPYEIIDESQVDDWWTPPIEDQYYAERDAVKQKYEGSYSSVQDAILPALNFAYTSAQMEGKSQEELNAIIQQKQSATEAMIAEYAAIDAKYGV